MRYAVLFTTYTWDAFVQRQYERIAARVREGDLFIVADETRGSLGAFPTERVVRTNQQEILHYGGRTAYVEKGRWGDKALLWWNLDFLTYRFYDDHQEYDYCITMDYDACITTNVDALIKQVIAAGYDFVALPVPEAMKDWYWQQPHAPVYGLDEIQAHLLCVTVISRKAANYLAQRRREMALQYKTGHLKFWPFCEAFMSTELKRGGFKVGNIAEFGNVDKFGWLNVYNEAEVTEAAPAGFIHPVLDEKRFIPAFLQRYKPVTDVLRPMGPFWRQLRRFPAKDYVPYLWPTFKSRTASWIARRLSRFT